ncbi:Palmitoyltransferase [Aphelenchoides bicaudatus]|nr:Palmitoyltransferase [Aphelenchoides bicaudatus]
MPPAPLTIQRRDTGFDLPLNGMQITSWVVLTFLTVTSFVAALPLPVYPGFQIIFAIAVLWIIGCVVFCTATDPGTGHKAIPVPFDRTKHAHVIERGFCNVCQINVETGTKHCRKCNKCIPDFDHHCKWLNNCIGSKNYRSFIVLVLSLVLFSLFTFIFFCWSLVHFISTTTHEQPVPDDFIKDRLYFDVWNWFILTTIILVMFGIVCASTLHLLSFHIMLFFNNQTTFSYIVKQKIKNKTIVENTDHSPNSTKSLPSMSQNSSAITDTLPSLRQNHVAPLVLSNQLNEDVQPQIANMV